jgi:probable blue pigment (indigoidine) exporter
VVGSLVAYSLWFRGISRLPAGIVAPLGLVSPVVATALGWAVLGQALSMEQAVGAVVVLASLAVATAPDHVTIATTPAAALRARAPDGVTPAITGGQRCALPG